MTAEDLRNKFKEEMGIPWENSQGEPDIDYVTWLEQQVISSQPLISTPTTQQYLDRAKKLWNSNEKLSALSIIRELYGFDLFQGKAYCEKHFN